MPATDWKEDIAPDEATRFEQHAAFLADVQTRNARAGVPSRALHAKANLGAVATLEVLPDVAADAKLGMFAEPKTYPALVRYSNGAARHQPDKKPDVRGFAVKVIGVAGAKVLPDQENAVTQDFLAIRTPATPVRDVDEFIELVRAARTPALLPLRLIAKLGLRRGLSVIKHGLAGLKVPTAPLAATT